MLGQVKRRAWTSLYGLSMLGVSVALGAELFDSEGRSTLAVGLGGPVIALAAKRAR
jgi:hypothetical protein